MTPRCYHPHHEAHFPDQERVDQGSQIYQFVLFCCTPFKIHHDEANIRSCCGIFKSLHKCNTGGQIKSSCQDLHLLSSDRINNLDQNFAYLKWYSCNFSSKNYGLGQIHDGIISVMTAFVKWLGYSLVKFCFHHQFIKIEYILYFRINKQNHWDSLGYPV